MAKTFSKPHGWIFNGLMIALLIWVLWHLPPAASPQIKKAGPAAPATGALTVQQPGENPAPTGTERKCALTDCKERVNLLWVNITGHFEDHEGIQAPMDVWMCPTHYTQLAQNTYPPLNNPPAKPCLADKIKSLFTKKK